MNDVNKCPKECKDNRRCVYASTVVSKDKTYKYEDPYYCGLVDVEMNEKLREIKGEWKSD